jgi:hypothetical protein
MIKKVTLAVFFISLFLITGNIFYKSNSNASGAPAGYTGSPGDGGSDCTACHSGTSVTGPTGMIDSDIQFSGYIPDSTYTISAYISESGVNKFGFEISPQDANGNLMGTMTVTNSTETKLISNNKYITHTSSGNTGTNNSKSWSFTWTAPSANSGDVTFYGAFNAANDNGTTAGDKIYTYSLTASEAISTGIPENMNVSTDCNVYPNPIRSAFSISYKNEKSGNVLVELLDLNGRVISKLLETNRSEGLQNENLEINEINTGVYFIKITTAMSSYTQRIMVI